MQLAVIGAGWVGVVTAVVLADLGQTVVCSDPNAARIQQLSQGEAPFFEPNLSDLLTRALASGRLKFVTDNQVAIATAEVVFCCVNTPTGSDGLTDVRAVEAVARDFAAAQADGAVFVIKSTVPAGTAAHIRILIADAQATLSRPRVYTVASNPEFLAESTAVRDTLSPARIVIGAAESGTLERVAQVYAPIIEGGAKLFTCDNATAEVVKTAANSFLATRISFMNEIANYCNLVGADPMGVAMGMGLDPRIGSIRPGVGYGGGCFPKDVQALLTEAERVASPLTTLQAAHVANYRQRELVYERLVAAVGGVAGKKIGVLGLAFKPKTDDVRDAPALTLIERLLADGATVTAYDPQVKANALPTHERLSLATSALAAAEGAAAVAVMCEWEEFQTLDLIELKSRMSGRVLVDGRYLWTRAQAEAAGLAYVV